MSLIGRLRVLLRQRWRNARDLSRWLAQQAEPRPREQRSHMRLG